MSNNIDERVVSMKFDNKTFEQNAGATLSTLDKLKQKLNFGDVSDASKKFSLNGVGDAIDGVNAKFAAMATIGITALANITNRAVNAGITMLKSLSVDPINDGLQEYETNLNSIQTILSNTKAKGSTLDDVNTSLNELNKYSDLTIYKFSDMANAIGRFTAAGVDLKTSTAAIKGLSNVAAVSGANTQQAATAMVQLSQAMASGTVRLQDWMSVENAGMGGEVFQKSLMETARVHGIAVDKMVKDNGSFRLSLQEGWLTSDIMSETLAKFTGDLTAAQLKSMGYTDQQIAGIQEMAKTAVSAAQDVKTGTQLLDTLKESVGSGWAATWQVIFGDFDQAKKLWTGIYNAINPIINTMSNVRNGALAKIFDGWRDMGGVDDLLKIITNTIKIFSNLVKPLKDAFGSVFPPSSTNILKKITGFLASLSDKIASGTSNLSFFKSIFQGVFSILKMAGSVVAGLVGGIGALVGKFVSWIAQLPFITKIGQAFSAVGDFVARMSGYFDRLTSGDVSGFITGLVTTLSSFSTVGGKASEVIQRIQSGLISVQAWINDFKTGMGGIVSMLTKGDFLGSAKTFGWAEDSRPVAFFLGIRDAILSVRNSFNLFGKAADEQVTAKADAAAGAWQRLAELTRGVGEFLKPGLDKVSAFFGEVVSKIKAFFDKATFQDILALVNTGLFMGFYMAARNFFKNFSKLFEDVGGTFKSITGVFDGLTGSLKGMQQQLQAKALMSIAIAVGILAASVALITLLDQDKIWSAVGAIGALIASLVGSMVALDKFAGDKGTVKVSIAIALIANSLLVMAGAVAIFGNMDTKTLLQGMTAVTVTLGLFVGLALGLSKVEGSLVSSSAAILILSIALTAFAGVIALFSAMDIGTMAEGLGYMAATLGIVAGAFVALNAVKQSMLEGAAAMLVVSFAMVNLAGALKLFATMSGGDALKAVLTLAASLGILVAAFLILDTVKLSMMQSAAALIVISAGLFVLAGAIKALASLSLKEFAIGIGFMAAAFLVLGAAGYFLGPAIAVLGVGLGLLGAGMLMAGAGFALFAGGMATLVALGGAGVVAITGIVIGLAQTIPLIAQQIGLGIKAFALVIANAGPELVAALTTVLLSLLTAVDNILPALFVTLGHLVDQLVWFLESKAEVIFQAGLMLLLYILNGINNNIGRVVDIAGSIIVNFINGLSRNLQRIIDAGGNLIINFIKGMGAKSTEILNAAVDAVSDFLDGLSSAAYRLSYKFTAVGGDIASAIIQGMVDGLTHGVNRVGETAMNVAKNAWNGVKNFLGINSPSKLFTWAGEMSDEGLARGFDNNADKVANSATDVGKAAYDGMAKSLSKLDSLASTSIDVNPTIAPVIDLSNVEKSAALITGMLTPPPLALDASIAATNDANAAVQAKAAVEAANEASAAQDRGNTYVSLEQNNTSPKALSEIEIYRQTKNLISTAKEVTA